MSHMKQPVVGEKPCCPKHPGNHIDFTCAAGLCPYRTLCKDCITEHDHYFPHHSEQVSQLNDWYKQYKRLAKYFDPRESYQMHYHFEEVEMILKKEKYELEKIANAMDDTFDSASTILVNKLMSLKKYLRSYLWKDFEAMSESYNTLKKNFTSLQKFNPRDEILNTMKQDLQKHFSQGNIKEYFDKVYCGHYDEKIFNPKLNAAEMIEHLKEKRKLLGEGFKVFDPQEFEKKWTEELDKFMSAIEANCDDGIFKRTKLDFLNPKSPRLNAHNKHSDSAKLTGITSLEGLSTSFVANVDKGLVMAISDTKTLNFLDVSQNFRVLKNFTMGEESILSVELLYFDPPANPPLPETPPPFLALLGGDDDYHALELWDCMRNKRLACLENVHDYGISCLKMLKKERIGQKEVFYVTSGAADGFIKLWKIEVQNPDLLPEAPDYKVKMELLKKIPAHDDYISSIVVIPSCQKFPESLLISSSHDKSVYIWEWEKDLKGHGSPEDSRENGRNLEGDDDEEYREGYGVKLSYRHTDRINGLALLNDKDDFSDLECFATAGGDYMLKIWRLSDKKMVKVIPNATNSPIFSMEYLKRDRIACTANDGGIKHFYVYIYNWRTASLLLCIKDHQTRVFKIKLLSDDMFATCDKSKTIKIWKLEPDNEKHGKDEREIKELNYKNGLLLKSKSFGV